MGTRTRCWSGADSGRCVPVGRAGTAVGLVADTSLHETTVSLGPGDALLFYTDGVTEARRGGGVLRGGRAWRG